MKRIALVLISCSLLFACNKKETGDVTKISRTKTPAMRLSQCDPGNEENPYDTSGILHNDALDYIRSQDPSNLSEIVDALRDWEANQYGVALTSDTTNMRGWLEHYPTFLDESSYSTELKDALISLQEEVHDMSIYSGDYADFCTFKANIVAFEDDVLGNSALTSGEKAIVLRASSIARYSCFYWTEYGPSTPEPSYLKSSDLWHAIVSTADADGSSGSSAVSEIVWAQFMVP